LLGFTYFYELGDIKNGAKWLETIMDNPQAPSFIKSIVSKLKFEIDQDYDVTLLFISDLLKTTKDSYLKSRLVQDFYAVKAERDIKCLNSKKDNCERNDANGAPYIKKNGTYTSAKNFSPFKIKIKRKSKI